METDSTDIIAVSDIVVSLRGRDAGREFFVTAEDGEYVYLADGRLRRAESPKKKKRKHVRRVGSSDSRAGDKLRNGERVTNAELRRALSERSKESEEAEAGKTEAEKLEAEKLEGGKRDG
jgi:ribosomal protein L14E/L6E/L27E